MAALGLHGTSKLPARLAALEAESFAIVSSGDDLVFALPNQTLERKHLRGDGEDGRGRLLRTARIDHCDAAVMRRKGETVSARRKRNRVNPASRVVSEFSADGVEGQPLAPHTRLRLAIDPLDEAGEDSSVGVSRAGGEEHGVGVPRDAGNGAANRLLQVLRYPPVILLFKVADGNDAVAGADGELGLRRGPSHKGSGSVDAKKHQGGFVARGRRLPDQGVAVYRSSACLAMRLAMRLRERSVRTLGACHDATTARSNVDAGDRLVMSLELILELERIPALAVKLDGRVSGNGQGFVVRREGVVRNGIVEEVVNLGEQP